MTELTGQLEGTGLGPLLDFLGSRGLGGRLTIVEEPFLGTLFLEEGQVRGAVLDSQSGLAALEAIVLGLGAGRFAFSDGAGPVEGRLDVATADLQRVLDELVEERRRIAAAIPSLATVPRIAVQEAAGDEVLLVPRAALGLLRELDGRRSVGDLGRGRGLAATLRQLRSLVELGLVRLDPPAQVARAI